MKDETAKTCMLDDAVIRGVARVVIKSGIHSRVIYDGKLGQVEVIAARGVQHMWYLGVISHDVVAETCYLGVLGAMTCGAE